MQREDRLLPVTLTPDELQDRGAALAKAVEEVEEIEAQQKLDAKEVKDRVARLKKEALRLMRAVRSGVEARMVPCIWSRDEGMQAMELFREDVGTRVDARPMSEFEKQRKLFPVDPPESASGGSVEG